MNCFIQYVLGSEGNQINIIDTSAPNIYLFANRVLERIFSNQEIILGSVEPTGRGSFEALDNIKIDKLKGEGFYLLNFFKIYFKIF